MYILGTQLYFWRNSSSFSSRSHFESYRGTILAFSITTGPETILHKEGTDVGFGLCACAFMHWTHTYAHTHTGILLKRAGVALLVFRWLFVSPWETEVPLNEVGELRVEDKRSDEEEVWEALRKAFFPPLEKSEDMWHGIQHRLGDRIEDEKVIIKEVETSGLHSLRSSHHDF